MNAIEHNRYTDAWSTFGQAQSKPSAVVCISAHWYVGETSVTAMSQPPTIYDFSGFPQALFQFQYPVKGSGETANRVAEILSPRTVIIRNGASTMGRGQFFATFSLKPMFR